MTMKYSKRENKLIQFIKNKRNEAYGLTHFEDGYLYQLAFEEFDNYCGILNLIENSKKEIEYKDKRIEELLNTRLYVCDTNKNKECDKRNCHINGGPCDATIDKEKAKYINLDDYVPIKKYKELEKEVERLNKIEKDYNRRMKASNDEILKKGYVPKEAIMDKIQEVNEEFNRINTPDNNEWYIESEKYALVEEKLRELLGE